MRTQRGRGMRRHSAFFVTDYARRFDVEIVKSANRVAQIHWPFSTTARPG